MDHRTNTRAPGRPPPAWLLVLAGAMLVSAALERLAAARAGTDAAGLERAALFPAARFAGAQLPALGTARAATPELASASARELRRLPGIGRRRAEAIVRARWEHGGQDFSLTEVRGIGPATAARVEAWLAEERLGAPAQSIVAE